MTVPHKFGETTVAEEPERVVVSVGLTEQDTLLQLGVVPVAVTSGTASSRTHLAMGADLLGDAEPEVLTHDGLEFEKIAALDPDLIVGTNAGLTEKDYDLSRDRPDRQRASRARPSTSPPGRTRPCRSPARSGARTTARR